MKGRLQGKRIGLTRPARSSSGLVARLQEAGAQVLTVPAIWRTAPSSWAPLDGGIAALVVGEFDGILFTSPAAVRPFVERLELAGGRVEALVCGETRGGQDQKEGPKVLPPGAAEGPRGAGARQGLLFVGAVGGGTAAALRQVGLHPQVVPIREDGASLAAAIIEQLGSSLQGMRFLQPRAEEGREELSTLLEEAGAQVEVAAAYCTHRAGPTELAPLREALRADELDALIFASPSAVEAVVREVGASGLGRALPVAIGETTARAIRLAFGADPAIARSADDEGLFQATLEAIPPPTR